MQLSDLTNLTKEDLLAVAGLAPQPSVTERVLGAAGYFGIGLVVGVGAALLLTPKSGKGLREDIGEGLRRVTGREKSPTEPRSPDPGSPEVGA